MEMNLQTNDKYNLGVQVKRTFVIKKLDEDYLSGDL